MSHSQTPDYQELARNIKQWAQELGFQQAGITDLDLSQHEATLQAWLDQGFHGEMQFMERHGMLRARPAELHPGSIRAISVRMGYLPPGARFAEVLDNPYKGFVSRYATGRDYHKLMRKRLKQLGQRIQEHCAEHFEFRPFVDSAPILERPLAEKAGLGWTGKHTLILDAEDGSWFFLGELLVNLPLPTDSPVEPQCGQCTACMTICPTQAIVAPYTLDARRCISYLTIEHPGSIPEAFRRPMGNRIYGCDDCQLICPFNQAAALTTEADFTPRAELHAPELLDLWGWSETTFLERTQGSPIRRIGYARWRRNLAIALGNAPWHEDIVTALETALPAADTMVAEHITWALAEQTQKKQHAYQQTRQLKRLVRAVTKGLPRDA